MRCPRIKQGIGTCFRYGNNHEPRTTFMLSCQTEGKQEDVEVEAVASRNDADEWAGCAGMHCEMCRRGGCWFSVDIYRPSEACQQRRG